MVDKNEYGPITNKDARFGATVTGRATIEKEGDKLEAPKNRIPSPASARTVYNRLRRNHVKRCDNYERIQGMLDGNPPYNPRRMRTAGLSDQTNVNWKDGKAVFNSIALAYWSLPNEVENIIEFRLSYAEDAGLNAEWGKVLSEEWDRMMRSWPDFNKRWSFHQSELIKFGLNSWFWADEKDWRPKPIHIKNFLIPDQTENDIESLNLVIIERTFQAQYLWEVYEKFEGKKDAVWNADALGKLLFELATISDSMRTQWGIHSVRDLQRYIKNNDLFVDELYNDAIRMVTILQKEYDGGITHLMIHRSVETDKFIFFADRQYKRFGEAVNYFCFSPGEEYIHGNKGLGHDIYSAIEAITQLDCSVLDQAKRAGSLLIKSSPTRGRDERQVRFVHGGVIDIGEATLEQNTLGSNVGQTIQASQYYRQKIFSNNNIAGYDPASVDRNVRSAKQVQLQATKEARVQKNQIAFYYEQEDGLLREIVRKQLNSSKGDPGFDYVDTWKKRCIKRGVPEQIFDVAKQDLAPNGLPISVEVFATRSSGSGSQVADQIEMREIMSILPTLGERGRVAVLMDYIASFRGFRYVSRYFPKEDRAQQPTAEDTIASLENNQLSEGKQVVVSPDNNHFIHLQAHLRMLGEAMKMYQEQGQDNTELLLKVNDIFATAGPHTTKHLLFMSQDPTRRAVMDQFRAQWAVLANFGDMIKNNAMAAQEAQLKKMQSNQEQAQAAQGDLEVKQMKVQGELGLKEQKLQADIERDRKRDQNKFLLQSQELANKDLVERIKTVKELARDAAQEIGDATGDEATPLQNQ